MRKFWLQLRHPNLSKPERNTDLQWTTIGQERPRYDLFTFLQQAKAANENALPADGLPTSQAGAGADTSPAEVQQGLGARRHAVVGPGQEVELRHRTRLARLEVLEVEAAHQVVVAPDVLAHKMDLRVRSGRGESQIHIHIHIWGRRKPIRGHARTHTVRKSRSKTTFSLTNILFRNEHCRSYSKRAFVVASQESRQRMKNVVILRHISRNGTTFVVMERFFRMTTILIVQRRQRSLKKFATNLS